MSPDGVSDGGNFDCEMFWLMVCVITRLTFSSSFSFYFCFYRTLAWRVAVLDVVVVMVMVVVAMLLPCHGRAGCGARNRSFPTNSCGYGCGFNALTLPRLGGLRRSEP